MKKRIAFLVCLALLAALVLPVGTRAAEPAVTLYGYRCFNATDKVGAGAFVSFSSDSPGSLSVVSAQADQTTVFAGTYAGGVYYGIDQNATLFTTDLTSFSRKTVGTVLSDTDTWEPGELTYDYSAGRLILLAVNRQTDAGSVALFAVDPQTAAATPLCTVRDSIDLRTLAASPSGTLYGIDLQGDLYTVDPQSGAAARIGSTGKVARYTQSMCFDRQTGALYWAHYDSPGTPALYLVDPQTGALTELGELEDSAEISGLCVATDAFHVGYQTEAGGSAGDKGGGFYQAGDRVTMTAVADQGYTFGGWIASSGVLTSQTTAETTLVMPAADVTVKAFFIPANSYVERTLMDTAQGVDVKGAKIYYNAVLSASALAETDEAWSAIAAKTGSRAILRGYRLLLAGETPKGSVSPNKGSLTVWAKVGSDYEGKILTAWQLIDGKVVAASGKVIEGMLCYKTTSLAPILITEGGTGLPWWAVVLLVLLGVAAVLYGIRLVNLLRIRIRRAKKAAKKQGSAKKKSLWARLRAWIRKTLGE